MEGYCLVADVLGFRELMHNLRNDPEEQTNRVLQWVRAVESSVEEFAIKDYSLFSDTVVVGTEFTTDGLRTLLRFSARLLERTIEKWLPIRGGIASGEMSWGQRVCYGNPVVDAYSLGETLQWVGIAGPVDAMEHIAHLWDWSLVCSYPVPQDRGELSRLAAVVWKAPPLNDLRQAMVSGNLVDDEGRVGWHLARKAEATALFRYYCQRGLEERLPPSDFIGANCFTPFDCLNL